MCNFVIRPIKSYATVDYSQTDEVLVKRGEYVDVTEVVGNFVLGTVNGDTERNVEIHLSQFVHIFKANPADIEKVRKEEASWFKSDKSEKPEK